MGIIVGDLEIQEVQPEITAKVIRFINAKEKFTTKELFAAYENTPEHLLRIALNNCRVEKKVFMHGNKRGAFYTKDENDEEAIVNDEIKNAVDPTLKETIFKKAIQLNRWFKRSELELDEDYYPIVILAALKELKSEGKIEIQGELRWTQYCVSGLEQNSNNDTASKDDLQSKILLFIKKNKVVTIPEIMEEFELQRYKIVSILDDLVEAEEIRHEGIKKASKYIYKTVTPSEVEAILSDVSRERADEESIDDLSDFLLSHHYSCMSIGLKNGGIGSITKLSNGSVIERIKIDSGVDGIRNFIKELTELQ